MELIRKLLGCKFLDQLGEDLESERAIVVKNGDEFYDNIYNKPYEDWCVAEHDEAEKFPLSPTQNVEIRAWLKQVYIECFEKSGDPELAGLLVDDLETITKLLYKYDGAIAPFTKQRLDWYLAGRFPCGYQGDFANGKWLIA